MKGTDHISMWTVKEITLLTFPSIFAQRSHSAFMIAAVAK